MSHPDPGGHTQKTRSHRGVARLCGSVSPCEPRFPRLRARPAVLFRSYSLSTSIPCSNTTPRSWSRSLPATREPAPPGRSPAGPPTRGWSLRRGGARRADGAFTGKPDAAACIHKWRECTRIHELRPATELNRKMRGHMPGRIAVVDGPAHHVGVMLHHRLGTILPNPKEPHLPVSFRAPDLPGGCSRTKLEGIHHALSLLQHVVFVKPALQPLFQMVSR
jgi:hypothetical protein